MNFFQKIINIGVKESNSDAINRKIRLSNILSVSLGLFIALPFGIISLFLIPSIAWLPFGGILFYALALYLNKEGYYDASRLIVALVITLIAVVYTSFIVPAGDYYPETYASLLAFTLIPFIVFDFNEKGLLLVALVFNVTLLFGFDTLNEWFETTSDISIFGTPLFGNIFLVTATFISYSSILIMSYENLQSQNRGKQLFEEMNANSSRLKDSENELKNQLKLIEENQVEEKKRNWSSEGLAKFSNLLRSNEDFNSLTDQVISELVKYLKANQGGLYSLEEDEDGTKYFELQAAYAYERKKHIDQKIDIGEGLLGQVYMEKDYTYMTDIPQNYVTITSGLGEATPRCLLIMPMISNEKVQGVIEIASFKELETYEIQFVKEIGEAIATNLNNNRVNEKTRILLEETKAQAEQLKEAEEEMRQNMEELQATQEEMERKEEAYVRTIEQLSAGQVPDQQI